MHDPYDGTNPGRFKVRDEEIFFDFVDRVSDCYSKFLNEKDNDKIMKML